MSQDHEPSITGGPLDSAAIFKREFNENTRWPMKHEPVGTNLFDATQATAMVRYMVEGLSGRPGSEANTAEGNAPRDDVETLKAALAKAVEGLEKIADHVVGNDYWARSKARETLAAIRQEPKDPNP